MDIDFPLILLVATAATGLITLADKLYFSKRRTDAELLKSDGENDEQEPLKEPFIIEQSKSFFPVLAFVFVLRSFIAEPFQIPSGSMEPGLINGDFLVVSKFHYGLRMPVFGNVLVPIGKPERGDVMVFVQPIKKVYYIKRLIGLPGDTVEYRNRQLTINGKPIETEVLGGEPVYRPVKFLAKEKLDSSDATVQWLKGWSANTLLTGPEGKWTVPEGKYFVMGDNRGNSADSRSWGFVPDDHIVGKALFVWMHWESWSSLPSFDRNKWIL